MAKRYEIEFLEIGTDRNHVHFLIVIGTEIQSDQNHSNEKKPYRPRNICPPPRSKEAIMGGEFWSDGYFVNTVSKFGSEETIRAYVKNQGTEQEYVELHKKTDYEQPTFF
ncbi:transposase [Paenibacillus hemerocallicola]|uniref:transposase n=1 Tax=Paenibacillus hemerocallicola TaxID=1172614 RepID=UPI003CCC8348